MTPFQNSIYETPVEKTLPGPQGVEPHNNPTCSDVSTVKSVLRTPQDKKGRAERHARRPSNSWLSGESFENIGLSLSSDTLDSSMDMEVPSMDPDNSLDDTIEQDFQELEILTQAASTATAPDPQVTCPFSSKTFETCLKCVSTEPLPQKRQASLPPAEAKRLKTAPTKKHTKRGSNDDGKPHIRKRHKDFRDIWTLPDSAFVTPFIENCCMFLRGNFSRFFETLPWGLHFTKFTENAQFLWKRSMTESEIFDKLSVKSTTPNTFIWLPFEQSICSRILQKLFRLSFTNSISLVCICPTLENDSVFRSLLGNPKHGSIQLANHVQFCPFLISILFLNCPSSPHLTVQNSKQGIFNITPDVSKAFNPLQNVSLIANQPSTDMSVASEIDALLNAAYDAENARQKSQLSCPAFPPLKLNNFVRKRFPFDITSNGPHFYPSKALFQLYPKNLVSKPKRKKLLSYKDYNKWCGDDSKITGHHLQADEMFCEKCGKTGHIDTICWMNIRSSKELGLTEKQDLVLNSFLLSLEQAPSCPPLQPHEDMIEYIDNLDKSLESKEAYFAEKWKLYAQAHKVSADLVQPGFSQMRQGLAYWYAISCPIFILQWVAFGIPVFWFFQRPPPFEVKPESKEGKWEESTGTTKETIKKFQDLQFILPIQRKFVHCCAPIFDRESSGSKRSIHDLRFINRFIMKINFSLFTAFNFCLLAMDGAVFIVTDFSKCWHQIKHLAQDMKYFVFRTVSDGQAQYWLPLGKTFGESDVPFAITELVSYLTALFNLFTLCSFWVDDGIIKVGNIKDANWKKVASRIRCFSAKAFSKLCLIVNDKCDFQPSIEKPWVGLWNAGGSTFLKAEKIQAFGNVLISIIQKQRITLGQALMLKGKITSFGLGLTESYQLKILNSLLKAVVHILDGRPKSASLPISTNFGLWGVSILNILLSSLTPASQSSADISTKLIHIACDASNIGGGLVITHQESQLFESSIELPPSHKAFSEDNALESSSTDNERFVFEKLALEASKTFLDKHFPGEALLLKIFTDSLPLAVQLNTFKLKSLRASIECRSIIAFLTKWGHPYEIHFHPRESPLAKLADANTRYFVPSFLNETFTIFQRLTNNTRFRNIDITKALLSPLDYFTNDFCEIIPLNLTSTLYAEIFKSLKQFSKCPFILCPKITHLKSVLQPAYTVRFEFPKQAFASSPHSFTILPFLLFECRDTLLTRQTGVTTVGSMKRHRTKLEDARDQNRQKLEEVLTSKDPYQLTSAREFGNRAVTNHAF